jgi:hypothetical protein
MQRGRWSFAARRVALLAATAAATTALAAAPAAAGPAAPPAPPGPACDPPSLLEWLLGCAGGVLWAADLESDDLTDEFAVFESDRVGSPLPVLVSEPALVRDGRQAVAFTIPAGGSRNEVVPRLDDLRPGDELYFGFSTRLLPGFPVDAAWQVVVQWKNDGPGSPPLSLSVEEGEFVVDGGFGHPDGPKLFRQSLGPAVPGRWDDWVFRIRFSPDPAVGFVEVWRNGRPVLPRHAPPGGTLYPGDPSYLKIGYYRNPEIGTDGTVVFDTLRAATSFAGAPPGGEPAESPGPATPSTAPSPAG